jgi:NAD(P)-dependent dehydrogenase (short-subunit alcohol dehydrogenase family)
MDFGSFTGRVAFVTSGSSGIGRAIVETLIAGGANVGVMARGQDELNATVAELNAKGPRGRGSHDPQAAPAYVASKHGLLGLTKGATRRITPSRASGSTRSPRA